MANLNQLIRRITFPGDNFRYGTIRTRSAYNFLSRTLRRNTTCRFRSPTLSASSFVMRDGYHFIKNNKIEHSEVVCFCNQMIDKLLEKDATRNQSKTYLLKADIGEISDRNPLLKFALNKKFIDYATAYLGMRPVLGGINIWYSPNKDKVAGGSQEFHLDYGDFRQVKCFVLLDETTLDNGPFGFIDTKHSGHLANKLNYKFNQSRIRVTDVEFEAFVPKSEIKYFTGNAGDMCLVDSSNCFHFGSREAARPRRILMFQYLTPYAFTFPFNYKQALPFKNATGCFTALEELTLRG